ncbi:MAG: metallophosphoesterase family protein [Acidobacteriota bacterium]
MGKTINESRAGGFLSRVTRIGVVAGTHPELARGAASALSSVDRILHAGRIGAENVLRQLGEIAPVIAVAGDQDYLSFGDRFPEIVELDLGGASLLMTPMIGTPPEWLAPIKTRLEQSQPSILVHADALVAEIRWFGGTLLVNPGRAGVPQPPGRSATCAVIEIDGPGRIDARIVDLSP